MWEFDAEATGEVMFDKVVNGFLPELFQRWRQMQVRHLISIVLFTRMEYHRTAASKETDKDKKDNADANPDEAVDTKDYYRVVVSDTASIESASILDRLKREFQTFLRDVSLREPVLGEYAPLGSGLEAASVSATDLPSHIVQGEPSSASQGNILEAINLASSQFSSDYIDRDLVRTGVSVVVISPGSGVFEVDHDLLVSTTDNLTDNGVGIDLVCLSRVPLHSVPLFKYRHEMGRQSSGNMHLSADNTPTRSYSNTMSLGTPTSMDGGSVTKPGIDTSSLHSWRYGIPHWIDISFWTTVGTATRIVKVPKSSLYGVGGSQIPYNKPLKPRVRMYDLQMMGISENALKGMVVPPLHPSSKRLLPTTEEKSSKTSLGLKYLDDQVITSGLSSPRTGKIGRSDLSSSVSPRSFSPPTSLPTFKLLIWMENYDDNVFKQRGYGRRLRTNPRRRRRNESTKDSDTATSHVIQAHDENRTDAKHRFKRAMEFAESGTQKEPRSNLTSRLRSTPRDISALRKISFGPRGLGVATPIAAMAVATTDNVNPERKEAKEDSSSGLAFKKLPRNKTKKTISSSMTEESRRESTLSPDSSESEVSRPIPIQRMTGMRYEERESTDSEKAPQYRIDELKDVSRDVPDDLTDAETHHGPELPTISPSTSLAPWLTVLNPCNPSKTQAALTNQLGRWQHLFPRPLKASQIKWKSLCSPAAVPLTNEDFPSPDQLGEEYREKSYIVSLPEEMDLSSRPRSLANELLAFRLSRGFQIVVGKLIANCLGTSKFEKQDVFSEHLLSEDGAQIYLSRGGTIHCLERVATDRLEVKVFSRHSVLKRAEDGADNQVRYTPLIRSMLADKYEEQAIPIENQRGGFDWQYIDSFIAGHERPQAEQYVEALRPWRARFVLIPTESPGNSRRTSRSKELNEEENRLEGIKKLTQHWQKCRYVLPEDRRYTKATRLKDDTNPLDVLYFTKKISAVVAEELQNATGVVSTIAPVQLLPEADLLQRSGLNLRNLADKLQGPDGIRIVDRRWHLKLHHFCFIGSELSAWIVENFKDVKSRDEAVELGNELMKDGLFRHVEQRHEFRDGHYFYQITDQFRAPRPGSKGIFGWTKSSVPPTPMNEAPTSDLPTSKPSHSQVEPIVTQAGEPGNTLESKPSQNLSVALGKSLIFNLVHGRPKQSYREELMNLHYDRLHNPDICFHIRIEWMNTTPKLIQDAVNHWAMMVEPYGLRLVEVPISEVSSITTMHPFRAPYVIDLAFEPLSKHPSTSPDTESFPSSIKSSENQLFQEAILQRFNFVLDFEAASSFPEKVDVTYSWGKPDFKYPQYIHRSGLLIAQISSEGRILLLANRLYNDKSYSARTKTIAHDDNIDRSPLRPNPLRTGDSFIQRSKSSPKHSPFSSPLLRSTLDLSVNTPTTTRSPLAQLTSPYQIQHDSTRKPSSTSDLPLDPEKLTKEIHAFCSDPAALEAFYTEIKAKPSMSVSMSIPSTPLQGMKMTPIKIPHKDVDVGEEGRIPALELPGSLTDRDGDVYRREAGGKEDVEHSPGEQV